MAGSRPFRERDLRFATDSGRARGRRQVLVPTARVGDRVLVVCSDPDELRSSVRKTC